MAQLNIELMCWFEEHLNMIDNSYDNRKQIKALLGFVVGLFLVRKVAIDLTWTAVTVGPLWYPKTHKITHIIARSS